MHHCPDCGQACYCHGDIDDCEVETVAYSSLHCRCPFDAVNGCGVECADHDEMPEPPEDDPTPKEPR